MGILQRGQGRPRVLVAGASNCMGGTEAVITNVIEEVGDAIDFDFIASIPLANLEVARGRSVIIVPDVRRPLSRRRCVRRFFASHGREYEALWLNCNHLLQADLLRGAARAGVPVRIAHAHNSEFLGGKATQLASRANRGMVRACSTVRIACSEQAGRFTFGTDDFSVLPDAIDSSAYAFSRADRDRVRQELGAGTGCRLVGTVGRLTGQKNQEYLVRRAARLVEGGHDVRLAVVGDGPLRGALSSLASDLGVAERVALVGASDDVAAYLSAFDVFAFPSAFEGFGMAALEAQFNGLPVIASENVPASVDVSTGVRHVPLSDTNAWEEALVTASRAESRLTGAADQYDIHGQRATLLRLFTEGRL